MSVDPTFLLRPKERTLEGVCAYLEADEAELRKEESKSKPDGRVLEELRHRIRVLQLKKAKFERLRDERKVSSGGFGSSVSLLTSAAAAAASGGNSGEGSVSSSPTQVRASFAVPEGMYTKQLPVSIFGCCALTIKTTQVLTHRRCSCCVPRTPCARSRSTVSTATTVRTFFFFLPGYFRLTTNDNDIQLTPTSRPPSCSPMPCHSWAIQWVWLWFTSALLVDDGKKK